MKSKALYSFMFMALTATSAVAATGAHHEPSIRDLLYPAINFTVLVAGLIFLLKDKTVAMFNKQAADIESLMNSAAQKNKDAEDKLKALQGKMTNLNSELAAIQKDYESDVAVFTQTQAGETQSTITRTKRDFESKLEGERNEVVEKLNEELINSVIAKTQQAINGSSDMKSRATNKIVSGLR